jgi:tetratricopeptide (TPR) repeat protein
MNKPFKLHTALYDIPLLRITFFSGLLLLLLIGGLLAGIFVNGRNVVNEAQESAFHRLLREYDFKYRQVIQAGPVMRRQELERLDSDLNRLEKQAEVVEAWLSVLKRRRQLAGLELRYEQSYRQSSQRAAQAFPYSEPIVAIAAAALIYNAAITREGEASLRSTLPLLASPRFAPMRLSLHVLLGDFKSADQALVSLPRDFTAPEYFTASALETEVIYPDLAILKILAGDIPSAAIDIQAGLAAFPSPGLIRLAAEYFYDFGDLLRSAELFSLLPDEVSLSRQADALWLAGYTDNARAIWSIQAATSTDRPVLPSLQNRALYNLALTAETVEEETELFERLVAAPHSTEQGASEDASRRFGLIRLSRLFEAPRAVAILETEKGAGADPLIDLEIVKRRTEIGEVARVIAETWLLLGRYPETEYLYQWGAWYFDLQRNYDESARLLKTAARHHFISHWKDFHQALQYVREGNLDAAEDLFAAAASAAVAAEEDQWAASANWGRVLEARRAPVRALEQYELALAVVIDLDENIASRIQVRIAHCLKTLGRAAESRRALEYALDLNPDNLTARLELNRLD